MTPTLALFAAALVAPRAPAGFLKGPYLQNGAPDSMVVCWQTDAPATGEVRYGTTSSYGQVQATAGPADLQAVRLTGLLPGTVYYYQVAAGGETSRIASFATGPQPEQPFTFVVVGDTRTDADAHQSVVDRILATVGAPDLYLNTGDLVEEGTSADQWAEFFEIEGGLMAYAPLYPVAGNHDDVENDSYYVQFFDLPSSTSATENWYAFTYGNVRFVVVDTNEDFVTGSEQYTWLEGELAAAHADAAIRHIAVSFHNPPYTSGAHGVFDPDDWQPPRTYLVPLFEQYGVDMVFNGHDHHYERADVAQTGGVLYVVAGGGGAPGDPGDFVEGLDDIVGYLGMGEGQTVGEYLEENDWLIEVLSWFVDGPDQYEGGWWRAEAEVVKHFVHVTVAGGYVEGSVYTDAGDLLDHWTIGSYDATEVDDDGDGWTERGGDCDDADAATNPGAADGDCDGVDEDCDGTDEGCGDPGDDTGPAPDSEPDGDGDEVEIQPDGCGCGLGRPGAAFGLALLALGALRRRRR
jgi:hypothetical protein